MRATRLLRLLAAALALTLVTAACGDDDDSSDGTEEASDDGGVPPGQDDGTDEATDDGDEANNTGSDPCELLSADDIAETFGRSWDDGTLTHTEELGSDQCSWVTDDEELPVMTFDIVTYTDDSLTDAISTSAAEFFQLNRDAATVDEELDLGDESFRSNTIVWVLEGDTIYVFTTFLGESAEAAAGLLTLAEQVVG